jgi:phosphoribosylcarboxyaminoimidazole (NCAIR) mutase
VRVPGTGHESLYSIVQTPSTFPVAGSYLGGF